MALIAVKGKSPVVGTESWIADNATVTGDVMIGENCSIWFQTVIRGDCNRIIIGDNVNIQDLSMVHGTTGMQDTVIGNNVSIGHRAIIHGCTIHDDVLIGMGAIVLDNTIVESNVIVAAGAVVTGGTVLESGFLYAGIPAKKIKPLDDTRKTFYIKGTAAAYTQYKKLYQ